MRTGQKVSGPRTFFRDAPMALRLAGRALLALLMFQFSEAAFLMVLVYIHLRYRHTIIEEIEGGPDWPEGM